MSVVMGQVSQLGNSELGFHFQVFQVLSLLLSLYIQSKVVVEIYMLCGLVVALYVCLPVFGEESMLGHGGGGHSLLCSCIKVIVNQDYEF